MDSVEKKELHIMPPQAIVTALVVLLGVLAFFVLILGITAIKQYGFIGSGVTATNTIAISGKGEVFAIPDTAEFSVTIREKAKDVQTAQTAATKKGNDVIAYLKSAGVEDKYIKTVDYSINPNYEWSNTTCTSSGYCPPGKQTLIGFEVTQTISVKTKDTKKAGELLSGVGAKGASEVSGLSFTVEDEDVLKAEARDKAITDARTKGEALARSLGVTLVRVVGFNENSGGYPVYYAKAMASDSMGGATRESAPSPELPVGQNKISSDISVTYEIR